jgi:hypothetical protein
MSQENYYTAPSDEVFEEIKQKSIEIWQTYDDTYGYATEKIDRVKEIKNVKDNYMHIIGMFDSTNQAKLFIELSAETKIKIMEAMYP